MTKEVDYSYEIYDLHYTSYDYYFEVYDARVNQFKKVNRIRKIADVRTIIFRDFEQALIAKAGRKHGAGNMSGVRQ